MWVESTSRFLWGVCILLVTGLFARQSSAKSCEGIRFEERIEVDGAPLLLNGIGIREATIFKVNVFVAGLYLARRSSDGHAIAAADENKRMIMIFTRSVEGGEMSKAIQESFGRATRGDLARLQKRIDTFKRALPDFKAGDKLVITYRPNSGTELESKAGKVTIPGLDFARALFLIWLGDKPPNPELKRGLLGGKCD